MYNQNCNKCNVHDHDKQNHDKYDKQKHVHEIVGSTAVEMECNECHNHRFCTVSDEAEKVGNSHVHEVKFRTAFSDKHYHEFCGKSGPAIEIANGKHVHFFDAITDVSDGHRHRFQGVSLIESPIDFKHCN